MLFNWAELLSSTSQSDSSSVSYSTMLSAYHFFHLTDDGFVDNTIKTTGIAF